MSAKLKYDKSIMYANQMKDGQVGILINQGNTIVQRYGDCLIQIGKGYGSSWGSVIPAMDNYKFGEDFEKEYENFQVTLLTPNDLISVDNSNC
jgi:hypothetical protein